MALQVVPYEAGHVPAVKAFNDRMGRSPFPISEIPPEQPSLTGTTGPLHFRHFLVLDESGAVRGGYFMRTQPFLIRGQVHRVGHYTAPVSEGILDKRYSAVGAVMLAHALKQQPLLFAMGMGGLDQPLPRLLKSMQWTVLETPFFFQVLRGKRFLRNAGPARNSVLRRLAADVLAYSGLGGLMIRGVQRLRTRDHLDARFQKLDITEFSEWADQVWRDCAGNCSLSAVRDSTYLRLIYSPMSAPFAGLRLTEQDTTAGWVQMLDCLPRNAAYFGKMKVIALVDGMAEPRAIPSLIRAAIDAAQDMGADMVISNQMHADWVGALRRAGFWQGPSNYLLALSKPLRALLEPLEEALPRIHFNRGDGDGLVNLMQRP